MAMRRVLALLVGAKAATTAKAVSAAQEAKNVPDHVPTEMPDDSFPGPDEIATARSWPSGHQPKRLAAWPQTWDSNKSISSLGRCWKVTVLQDRKVGWPGVCLKLYDASVITKEEICQSICMWDSRCAVWQFVNQTTPGQCWLGFGEDCIWRNGEADEISVQGAQRLMHGEVRVLKNLTGWKINNLYNIPMHHEGNVDVSILRCKAWCYSSIFCEYWQYGPGGCWVDHPIFTTGRGTDPDNRVQYPMTTSGGCTNTTSEASAMMWGEYIQHYCPPQEEAPQAEEDEPKMTLGAAVAQAQPTQDGVLGMPTWVMVAILLGLAACVVLCVYMMSQKGAGGSGSKRETSKASRTTRGMQMSAEYQEELTMDSMVEASPNARSQTPSEYSDGAMDGIPPPPDWEPMTTAAAMQPGFGYGARDLNTSQAHSQHSAWWGGQHGGQHHPHHFPPTQRLDAMPPPPNPYEQGARGAHPPGVPFPAPPPPYHGQYGQSAPQYGHYRHRWY